MRYVFAFSPWPPWQTISHLCNDVCCCSLIGVLRLDISGNARLDRAGSLTKLALGATRVRLARITRRRLSALIRSLPNQNPRNAKARRGAGYEHPAKPGNGWCVSQTHHPLTPARFARAFSCQGDARAHA